MHVAYLKFKLHIKFDRSQRLQEREQVGLGLPWLCVRWLNAGLLPERLHGVALHLQVDRDVATCRCDAGMAKVVADHRHVASGLQQCHGATVAQDVRRDLLSQQYGVVASRCARVLREDVGDAIARQGLPVSIDEHALSTVTT